ncbi:MAG: CpaB family protein [Planctomycetota bacterium]
MKLLQNREIATPRERRAWAMSWEGRKSMKRNLVIVALVVLGALAVGGAMILAGIVLDGMSADDSEEQYVTVLVAAEDLDSGLTIHSSHVKRIQVPIKEIAAIAKCLEHPVQAIGFKLVAPLTKGQIITVSTLVPFPKPPPPLGDSLRGVAPPVSRIRIQGGQLYPGCKVDIHPIVDPNNMPPEELARAMETIQGIKVLATIPADGLSDSQPVLEMNDRQANTLQSFLKCGTIKIVLHKPQNP